MECKHSRASCGLIIRLWWALLAVAPAFLPATAQSSVPVFDATELREPRNLDMPWLVQSGDDPRYARPEFDDSQWTRFDPSTSIVEVYGKSRPETVWYRLHVRVDPADKGLGLSEVQISRAFEVYVNGERLIASGRVKPYAAATMNVHLLARIPDRLTEAGTLVIAVRVHVTPIEWKATQNPGYYANNLTLGQYQTLYRERWLTIIGDNWMFWLDNLSLICVGAIALVLLAGQRRQAEYRWIAALGALKLLQTPEPVLTQFVSIPLGWEVLNDSLRMASPYVLVSLYFSFVGLKTGWRWKTFLVIAGVANVALSLEGVLLASPPYVRLYGNLPFIFLLAVLLPVILALHWRRGNREAGILLIPVVLLSLFIYAEVVVGTLFQLPACRETAIRVENFIAHHYFGPFVFSADNLSGILSSLSLAVIMLMRSSENSRRQAHLEAEFEAAHQVQQVLVPEKTHAIPGFAVDSVYLPAQQVGGDFFQVLPDGEGGILLVVGDVAGKGLPAAMLVSALIGAIRATAEFTQDPGALLASLNERLVGRAGGGFSTALAAHIGSDGWMSIANAGHLSPYLDGREMDLPGALPLGVASGTAYSVIEFALNPGSRLTFYSDGVVEAQNGTGEMFGFGRSEAASMQPARAIAEGAREFGQQDDITVVTIEWQGIAEPIAEAV